MKIIEAVVLAAALTTAASSQAQPPIKIGFMAELSGPQGVLGQEQYDGFMLAVQRNGGKLGGAPVEVIREDSQLKPELAVQLTQKLIEKEKVSIITGITFSNIMMAVHKPITDKEIFLIGSNGGPASIAGAQCSPYQFIVSWQNDMQSEVVGKYAQEKGYKRVVALAPNYQAGKDYVAGFKRFYKSELAGENYTPLNQQDFSAEISQIAASRPDAVFVFYPGALGINFVQLSGQGAPESKGCHAAQSRNRGQRARRRVCFAPPAEGPLSQPHIDPDSPSTWRRLPDRQDRAHQAAPAHQSRGLRSVTNSSNSL